MYIAFRSKCNENFSLGLRRGERSGDDRCQIQESCDSNGR